MRFRTHDPMRMLSPRNRGLVLLSLSLGLLVGSGSGSTSIPSVQTSNEYVSVVQATYGKAHYNTEVAISPDGQWIAAYSPHSTLDVSLYSTDGRVATSVPLPASTRCSNATWDAAGLRLALACSSSESLNATVYLWRRGQSEVTVVDSAGQREGPPRANTPMGWLSGSRKLWYTVEQFERPITPGSSAGERGAFTAQHAAGVGDDRCLSPGFPSTTVTVACSDKTDVFRSTARAVRLDTSGSSSEANREAMESPAVLTRVMIYDADKRASTLVASIRGGLSGRGQVTGVALAPDGRYLLVSIDAGPHGIPRVLPFSIRRRHDVYMVSLAHPEQTKAAPPLLDVVNAVEADDSRVVQILASVPVGGSGVDRLAVDPRGRSVAWVRRGTSRKVRWGMRAMNRLILAPLNTDTPRMSVDLDSTGAGIDRTRALQWCCQEQQPVYTPDGARILVAVNGFLWEVDSESRAARRLSDGLSELTTGVLWTSDRAALVSTLDPADGSSCFWWVDLATGIWRIGDRLPHAVVRAWGVSKAGSDEAVVAYIGETLRSPANVYVVQLGAYGDRGGAARRLTDVESPQPLPETSELVFDYRVEEDRWGTGVIVRPEGAEKPLPAILWSHPGTPGIMAERVRRFGLSGDGAVDVFGAVARGYAVLLLDIPMSPVDEYHGGPMTEIVQAVTAGIDAAVQTGWIDRERMGVVGTSFGGYMVNVLVTQMNEFQAGASLAGPSSAVNRATTFHLGMDWAYAQGGMVKPLLEAPGRYVLNSPVAYLDAVTTPLLLIHGTRDTAVHISQSEEMFRGLADRGKEVELVRYHGLGHGLQLEGSVWVRVLDWFDEHLR